MEVIAEGLAFPEGPVIMADGSVIVVEVKGGRITRCWNDRKETVCEIGGGPNGAAIGSDGALWICNNGGFHARGPGSEGRIERVDLATGRFDRVYESCDGIALEGPNDMVFDESGRLWFTDLGKVGERERTIGGLFAAHCDGSSITALYRRSIAYNGIGLSPDQKHLYVADSSQARVYRYDARPEPQDPHYVTTAMGAVGFDSLAVTAAGNICIATLHRGGITTVTPSGESSFFAIPEERIVTNLAFGGEDMRDAYVTLATQGKLVKLRWDEPGLPLAFSA